MIMTGGFFFLLDAYRRHRLPGICFILQALLKKQKIPSQHLCWDRKLPAVPPGLALLIKRPLFTYGHMRIVVNGEVRSVAHTPPWGRFCLPSEVHSVRHFPPRSQHPRLSAGKEGRPTHSSSSVWLHDTTRPRPCQEKFQRFKAKRPPRHKS